MSELAQKACEPSGAGGTIPSNELWNLKTQIPDWDVVEHEGVPQLQRSFAFSSFTQALQFANQVGDLAEEFDHHPQLIVEWGKTTVKWWTHKIGGLHINDLILAAKTDELVAIQKH